MNYILVSRGDDYSNKVKLDLINHLNKLGFINIEDKISKNNKDISLDYVFSIGGDGTFLRSVQSFYSFNPLFITINTGNFGYLCEYKKEEIITLIKKKNITQLMNLEFILLMDRL